MLFHIFVRLKSIPHTSRVPAHENFCLRHQDRAVKSRLAGIGYPKTQIIRLGKLQDAGDFLDMALSRPRGLM
jgi:hypothetical protein